MHAIVSNERSCHVIRSTAVVVAVVAVVAALHREAAHGALALSELSHGLHPRDVDKLYDRSLVSSGTGGNISDKQMTHANKWTREYSGSNSLLAHAVHPGIYVHAPGVRNGEARVAVALVEALVQV